MNELFNAIKQTTMESKPKITEDVVRSARDYLYNHYAIKTGADGSIRIPDGSVELIAIAHQSNTMWDLLSGPDQMAIATIATRLEKALADATRRTTASMSRRVYDGIDQIYTGREIRF